MLERSRNLHIQHQQPNATSSPLPRSPLHIERAILGPSPLLLCAGTVALLFILEVLMKILELSNLE